MLFTFVVLILVINIFRFMYLGKKRAKSDGSDSGEDNMSKKDLALQQAMDQITSTFGKGSIMWLGRTVSPKNVPVVSTGSFALDIALGIFGLPKVSSYLLLFLHLNQHWTFCF
jgi:recombination protein RecA